MIGTDSTRAAVGRAPARCSKLVRNSASACRQPSFNPWSLTIDFDGPCDPGNACAGAPRPARAAGGNGCRAAAGWAGAGARQVGGWELGPGRGGLPGREQRRTATRPLTAPALSDQVNGKAALSPEMALRIESLVLDGHPAAHAGLHDSHAMRPRGRRRALRAMISRPASLPAHARGSRTYKRSTHLFPQTPFFPRGRSARAGADGGSGRSRESWWRRWGPAQGAAIDREPWSVHPLIDNCDVAAPCDPGVPAPASSPTHAAGGNAGRPAGGGWRRGQSSGRPRRD
jgi:hypothetical protein